MPGTRYPVRVRREIGRSLPCGVTPPWLSAGEVTLPGTVLSTVGPQIPA